MDRSSLTARLAGFSRLRKTVRDLHQFISLAVLFLASFLAAGLSDFFFQFTASFRWLLFLTGLAWLGIRTARRFVPGLLQPPDLDASAIHLDDRLATGDVFINAWQLRGQEQSSFFVRDLVDQAERLSRRLPLWRHLDVKPTLRRAGLAALLLGVILGLFLVSPRDVLYHGDRVLFPWENRGHVLFDVRYSLLPGNCRALAGTDLQVRLHVSGRLRACSLRYETGRGQTLTEPMTLLTNTATNAVYGFTFREVNRPFHYSASLLLERKRKIVVTPQFDVDVFYSPVISAISVLYRFPAYTGRDPRLQEESGDVEALRGTTAEIRADVSEDLAEAVCLVNGVPVRCGVRGNRVTASFQVGSDGEYWFRFRDANGQTNVQPVRYAVRCLADGLPRVHAVRPGHDLEVTTDEPVSLAVEADDDNLIRSLSLVHWKQPAYSDKSGPTNRTVLYEGGRRELKLETALPLDGLSPGDAVRYFFEADDGCPYESHRVRSDEFSVRFPSMEDLYRDIDSEERKNLSAIDDLRKEQKEYFEKMAEIQEQVLQKKDLGYVERKQLEALLQKEKEVQQQTREVAESLQNMARNVQQNRLQSQKIAERMQEINQLLRDVADRDMQDQMERLGAALEKVNLTDKDRQKFGQKLGQDELLRKLDNTARMLKETRKARRLNEMVKRAEDLVRKQEDLASRSREQETADRSRTNDIAKMKNEQDAVRQGLDQLRKDMDALAEQYKDADPEFSKSLKDENRKLEDQATAQTMQSAAQDLSDRNFSQARQKQDKALGDLMSLMNSLEKKVTQRQQQNVEELLSSIDASIVNLSGLSREQSGVCENVRNFPRQAELFPAETVVPMLRTFDLPDPSDSDLAETEIVLDRVLKALRKTLQEEIEKNAYVPPEFYAQFDTAGYQMLAAKAALEQKNPYLARKYAENASTVLNTVILQLLKMREQARQQGQGSESRKQDMGESMDQLSQRQQSLNGSTRQMMGKTGQQGMTPGDQEYLKELAYQQQMIKGAFDDLMSRNPEESGKMLGDMSGLSKEMGEVVKQMQSGRLDEDLVKRQQKILERMLDSQKALKVKDESPERKAEQADRNIVAEPPAGLTDQSRRRTDLQLYRDREKFPEEYRQVIENYLELLTR